MDKLQNIKEIIKKLKEGRQSFKKLSSEWKQLIIEHVIKVVAIFLLKYVFLPLAVVALVISLLYNVFYGAFVALAKAFGNMAGAFYSATEAVASGLRFFIGGRGEEINPDEVAYTKQELEKAGVDFDELGYLGEYYLQYLGTDYEEKIDDDEYIEIKMDGFTSSDGKYTKGDYIYIETDPDEDDPLIPSNETATKAVIEYKEFLDKKMEENEIEAEVIIYRYNVDEDGTIVSKLWPSDENELKGMLKEFNGQKVKVKDVDDKNIGGKTLELAEYYTVLVKDDEGRYDKVDESEDYYKEQQKIKTEAILWYLKKCYEAQAYTYKNINNFTIADWGEPGDERDKGGIIITFATDCLSPDDTCGSEGCEKHQCYEIPGAIGFEQKSFYRWTGMWWQPTFGVIVDETERKFYAKLNDTPGSVYNSDITSYVFDYAMPWNYPFAFYETTLAPDIGYLVSRLAKKYHRLELKIYALKPKLENSYTGDYHSDSPEPAVTAGSRIETVRTHQSTWYKNIDTQYQEVYTERARVGYVYNLDKYEVTYEDDTTKPIKDADGNTTGYEQKKVETKIATDKKYYSTTELSGKKLGRDNFLEGAEDYYVTTTINNEVYQLIPELMQVSHTETLNNEGINSMDSIMKSISKYSYDATTKRIKLDNEEDLKFYYTANKYMVNNSKTFKHKLLDGTEKTYYIKGKTELRTDEVAQPIVDAIYTIYDDDINAKTNLGLEIDFAKGEKLTQDEYNNLRTSNHDKEKDYTLAKPIVKELITYFWNMGALDPENENLKNVAQANLLTTIQGDIAVWPVEQPTAEIGNFTYDATTKIATIPCAVDSKVVAPIAAKVSGVLTLPDGTITVVLEKPLAELKEDGTPKIQTIYIGNLKSATVVADQEVTASQQIGVANGPITYQVMIDGERQDIEQDLTNMGIAAKSSFKWPIRDERAFINSHFGPRTVDGKPDYHYGVDFNLNGASINQQPIYASRDGTVILVSDTIKSEEGKPPNWGNHVKIDHGDNTYTLYAHMYPNSIKVKVGDKVTTNTVIGNVGTTGWSTGPHLHFEIYVGGSKYKVNNVDPEPYLMGQARVGGEISNSSVTTVGVDFNSMLQSFEGDGSYEGAVNTATQYQVYLDSEGYRTIGYGVALRYNVEAFQKRGIDANSLNKGDYVDRKIVDEVEQEELKRIRNTIIRETKKAGITDLKEHQIEALMMRCYQLGETGGLSLSSDYKRNGRTFVEAYKEFGNTESLGTEYLLLPNSGDGDGRTKRRKAEWKLFHTGQYSSIDDY